MFHHQRLNNNNIKLNTNSVSRVEHNIQFDEIITLDDH